MTLMQIAVVVMAISASALLYTMSRACEQGRVYAFLKSLLGLTLLFGLLVV